MIKTNISTISKKIKSEALMSVKEALKILEDAAAKNDVNMKEIFSSEYKNLRKAVLSNAPEALWDKIKNTKNLSLESTKNELKDISKTIKENPWYLVGTAALVAGLIGFLFGRSSK